MGGLCQYALFQLQAQSKLQERQRLLAEGALCDHVIFSLNSVPAERPTYQSVDPFIKRKDGTAGIGKASAFQNSLSEHRT